MKIKVFTLLIFFIYCSCLFSQKKDSSNSGLKLKDLIKRENDKSKQNYDETKTFNQPPKINLLFPNSKKYNTNISVLQVSALFRNISNAYSVTLKRNSQVVDVKPVDAVTRADLKLTWNVVLSEGLNEFEVTAKNNLKTDVEKFTVDYHKPKNPQITLISPAEMIQITSVSVFTVIAEFRNVNDENDVIFKKGKRDKLLASKKEKISDGIRLTWDIDLNPGSNDFEIIAKNNLLNTSSKFAITYKEPPLPKLKVGVWAVVVGISKYKNSEGNFQNLKYAASDAQYFYEYLKYTYGNLIEKERVTLLVNEKATRANIIREIKEKSKRAEENDLIFIYFAGHGVAPNSNRVFFYCYDTEPDLPEATAIPNSDITSLLDGSAANKKILVADACHSGFINKETRGISRINEFILDLSQKQGYYIFTSAKGSEEAQEGEKWGGGHGVFTYHFVQGLKGRSDVDGNKVITIEEIYEYVQKKVREDTEGRQNPQLKDNNNEDDFPISIVK